MNQLGRKTRLIDTNRLGLSAGEDAFDWLAQLVQRMFSGSRPRTPLTQALRHMAARIPKCPLQCFARCDAGAQLAAGGTYE